MRSTPLVQVDFSSASPNVDLAIGGYELAFYEYGGAGRAEESTRRGYLPPHQVDAKRLDSGKTYAHRSVSNVNRRTRESRASVNFMPPIHGFLIARKDC